MLKLHVVEGNAAGSDIAVEEELMIGRTASEEGRLGDDPEISRQHARVSGSDDGYVIEDLGSMNGTFVNGNRLQAPHQLADGDQIELGGTHLMAQLPQSEATPTPGTEIPQQDELGATRIADVPAPAPPPPAPPPSADTFVADEPVYPGPPPPPRPPPPPAAQAPAGGPQAPAEPPGPPPPAPPPAPPPPVDMPPPPP